jgi:DNA (cytosine-5)-methyltransferase 1
VPPLLAYQIALSLGEPGLFLDLFSGAGGLGLGFKWAGWQPVIANDIDAKALETYRRNVHEDVLQGDIQDPTVTRELVSHCSAARRRNSKPFWILGGPPCQGFSTAGKPRTMEDNRNHLFWSYRHLVEELKPDGFVFENVSGLLNMEDGRVYQLVKDAFSSVMPNLSGWVVSAVEYALPQRRTRVILVGTHDNRCEPPSRLTALDRGADLFSELQRAVSAKEALDDLPILVQGQNGVGLPYREAPAHAYQALMRGALRPGEYLALIAPQWETARPTT